MPADLCPPLGNTVADGLSSLSAIVSAFPRFIWLWGERDIFLGQAGSLRREQGQRVHRSIGCWRIGGQGLVEKPTWLHSRLYVPCQLIAVYEVRFRA